MTKHLLTALAAVTLVLSGCDTAGHDVDTSAASARAKAATPAGTPANGVYVLIAKGTLPSDIDAQVAAAGGTLTRAIPEIGVAFAKAEAPDFQQRAARSIAGLEAVAPDVLMEWTGPVEPRDEAANLGGPAADEPFSAFQWPLVAINAEAAWASGVTGEGVRVAIIDGGIRSNHIDLASQLDFEASRSFVPPETTPNWDWNEENPLNTFWHGTHVAGIVGAADNARGMIGVAPGVTLIGVKALHDFNGNSSGSGQFEWIINAIYYAASPHGPDGAGADIINMSLGATLDEKDRTDGNKEAVRELKKALDRATRYAWQQGVLVVASAGNGATNFDVARTLLKVPAQDQHVLGVSATAPTNWAAGGMDFATLASYSDFGKSLVDVAAPGGDFDYPGNEACVVAGLVRPCWVFDGYFSTTGASAGSYSWAQGTSMASPTVAGVAALVMERFGTGNPARIMSQIQSTATDLGKPGMDEVYGHGFVNAAAAVGATVASN